MSRAEDLQALVAFTSAEMEYLKLIREAVDMRSRSGRAITVEQWREIARLRRQKDDLEQQVYAILRNHGAA